MKKRLCWSIVALLGCSTVSFAQKDAAFLGAKLGMNIANCTNSDGDPRIGLNIGVMGQYFVTNQFAIEGDLLYSQQGLKGSGELGDVDANVTLKLDYLNIPILAKFYPLTQGFNVYAGPQFGFAVNKKAKAEINGTSVETKMEDINTFDFGFALGVGYDFDFGLLVDVRYTPSVSKILKDVDSDENGRNSVFTIGVGYKF